MARAYITSLVQLKLSSTSPKSRNQSCITKSYLKFHSKPVTVYFSNPMQLNPPLKAITMKLIVLLVVLATVSAQKYEQKYDNVSIESVLSNDRVLTNYIKCLLDKGACTKEGRELKRTYFD